MLKTHIIKPFLFFIILISILISFIHDDLLQIRYTDAAGAFTSMNSINQYVSSNDLIFLKKYHPLFYEVTTPLEYFFNFNTYLVDDTDQLKKLLKNHTPYFQKNYQNVFFMLPESMITSTPKWLTFVSTIAYQQGRFLGSTNLPPSVYQKDYMNFSLYRVNLKAIEAKG